MRRLSAFLNKRNSRDGNPAAPPTPAGQQQSQGSSPPPVPQRPAREQIPLQLNEQRPIIAPPGQLSIALQNQTSSNTVYAYVTGRAIDRNGDLFLLQSDGSTGYYPTSPSNIMSNLEANCAIPLGNPGNIVYVQIPHIAGGRIWFSMEQPLTFFLNPGPALVEPSVTNGSDPNANVDWGFCEFTFNSDQLYANISYVDFVSLPISLTLDTVNSGIQHISGMGPDGLERVAEGMRAQHANDGIGWDKLIIPRQGSPNTTLRVLSPNQGMVGNPDLFSSYYDPYIEQVYTRLQSQPIGIDTQAGWGVLQSHSASPSSVTIGNSTFSRPSTRDIFTCSTGPFATGSNAETNTIIPRFSAAFNRSTLLKTNDLPADKSLYYQETITNHYSRVVHTVNLDGKGYAFPYDDVQPSGGGDQSGEVHAGDPKLFTIAVGGRNVYA